MSKRSYRIDPNKPPGRPKLTTVTKPVTVYLTEEQVEWCKSQDDGMSDYIRHLITKDRFYRKFDESYR